MTRYNDTLLTISQAAKIIGVNPATLRLWDLKKVFIPKLRSPSGHRRYSLEQTHKEQKKYAKKK